jgi:hypothetical protein
MVPGAALSQMMRADHHAGDQPKAVDVGSFPLVEGTARRRIALELRVA